jgi:hypothetical protein
MGQAFCDTAAAAQTTFGSTGNNSWQFRRPHETSSRLGQAIIGTRTAHNITHHHRTKGIHGCHGDDVAQTANKPQPQSESEARQIHDSLHIQTGSRFCQEFEKSAQYGGSVSGRRRNGTFDNTTHRCKFYLYVNIY